MNNDEQKRKQFRLSKEKKKRNI